MASTRVTFSCGHTIDKGLYYQELTQRKVTDPMQRQLCAACYERHHNQKKQEEQQKYEQQNARAALKANERNLPSLAGSQKQVAFANSLREFVCEVLDLQTSLQALVQEQTTASFWLDLTKPKEGRTDAQQVAARIIAMALAPRQLGVEESKPLKKSKARP